MFIYIPAPWPDLLKSSRRFEHFLSFLAPVRVVSSIRVVRVYPQEGQGSAALASAVKAADHALTLPLPERRRRYCFANR